MDMSFLDLLCMLSGAAAMAGGIYTLITGKTFGRDASKFKKEDLEKIAPYEGTSYLVLGAGVLLSGLIGKFNLTRWLLIPTTILVVGGIAIEIWATKKFLGDADKFDGGTGKFF